MKVILKSINLILLCLAFPLKADVIPIFSLNTNEGAEIECNNDNVTLSLYGETYQTKILVTKSSDSFMVASDTEYYNVPYYAEDEEQKSVFNINKKYFIVDNKVVPAISLDPIHYKDSNEELSVISAALNEAHQNGKCMLWAFSKD